jgi:hypothetical protein
VRRLCRRNLANDDPLRHRQRALRHIEDRYLNRGEAEATPAGILSEEPDFEGELWVEAVEFELAFN